LVLDFNCPTSGNFFLGQVLSCVCRNCVLHISMFILRRVFWSKDLCSQNFCRYFFQYLSCQGFVFCCQVLDFCYQNLLVIWFVF
jgi:hypothetical protein